MLLQLFELALLKELTGPEYVLHGNYYDLFCKNKSDLCNYSDVVFRNLYVWGVLLHGALANANHHSALHSARVVCNTDILPFFLLCILSWFKIPCK